MDFLYLMHLFPTALRDELQDFIEKERIAPEEIRLRIGSPMTVRWLGGERRGEHIVTKADMLYLIGNATDCSYHTAVGHLQQGYIPLRGGGRMGLCGTGCGADGVPKSLDEIVSVCIRVSSQQIGCGDEIFPLLTEGGFRSTIIIGPPGAGKTTLLRELIRKLSCSGLYVGVADERREIGGEGYDLGLRTDVMAGVKKSVGAMMLLRSMSPNVIAMDEITAYADMDAIMEAVGCGAELLTTMHGNGISAVKRPGFRPLYEARVFERAVLIGGENGKRIYEVVELYDEADGCIGDP